MPKTARAPILAGDHIDHAMTAHRAGAEAGGDDPPDQKEAPMQVEVTGASNDPPPHRYRIRVRGRLGETMRSAFPALQAGASGRDTLLMGALRDQAEFHGVLAEIEALGLELLEVRRLQR